MRANESLRSAGGKLGWRMEFQEDLKLKMHVYKLCVQCEQYESENSPTSRYMRSKLCTVMVIGESWS